MNLFLASPPAPKALKGSAGSPTSSMAPLPPIIGRSNGKARAAATATRSRPLRTSRSTPLFPRTTAALRQPAMGAAPKSAAPLYRSAHDLEPTDDLSRHYEVRAAAFYQQAVSFVQRDKPSRPRGRLLAAGGGEGNATLRQAISAVQVEIRRSKWTHLFTKEGRPQGRAGWDDDPESESWRAMRERFAACTKQGLHAPARSRQHERRVQNADAHKRVGQLKQRQLERASTSRRLDVLSLGASDQHAATAPPSTTATALTAQFPSIWSEASSPAWDLRTSPAWGGLGWQFDLLSLESADGASLQRGWDDGVANAASDFDARHAQLVSTDLKQLLATRTGVASSAGAMAPATRHAQRKLNECLFKIHSNRFAVQPLRMSSNVFSSTGSSSQFAAQDAFKKPLALTGGPRGGPLVPVCARKLATDAMAAEEEPEPAREPAAPPPPPPPKFKAPWTLHGSIWGPRCAWCDGQDFYDTEDVVFERFASDWQRVLRLGAYKMIMDSDDNPGDADGDGVPDEIEDVGAVLFFRCELYTLAWQWYSDSIFSAGADLDNGIKKELGWKMFTDEIGVWSHLSEAEKASKNTMIFMTVDKTNKTVAAAIAIQSSFRGQQGRKAVDGVRAPRVDAACEETVERIKDDLNAAAQLATAAAKDKSQAITAKMDNQLSRAEFVTALVKTAIERFVRTRQNPQNELTDVSDAVEKLFREHLEPALARPLPGRTQPKLPLPDTFRETVCYTEAMTDVLDKHAPSLRVLFACLAKVCYERSRNPPPALPKIGKSRVLRRDGSTWTQVPGLVSFGMWGSLVRPGGGVLPSRGPKQRELSLCFVYSVMCVIDGQSEAGGHRERNLPFEGFLEALIRLATLVPLPTDAMLEAAELVHAGAFLARVEQAEAGAVLDELIEEQRAEWGDVPDPHVAGAMPRRVDMLIDVMLRAIKQPTEPDEPLTALTRRDVRVWAMRTLGVGEHELPDSWAKEKQVGE